MARLNQGILGGISGKIGNVVGSSWKGIAVIKSKPLSVSNPRTAGQIAQRSAMSTIVAASTVLLSDSVKPLWDRFAQRKSGYNAFVQANISNCDGDGLIIPSSFVLAKGKMQAPEINSAVASQGSQEIVVFFPTTSGDPFALSTDLAYAVAYSATHKMWFYNPIKTARDFGETVIVFDDMVNIGETLHIYLVFKRADGTVVSSTGYESTVVLA